MSYWQAMGELGGKKALLLVILLAGSAQAGELGNYYLTNCYEILGEDECSRIQLRLSPLDGLAGETRSFMDDNGVLIYVMKIDRELWAEPNYIHQLRMYEWQITVLHELCHIKAGLKADHNRRWQKCARRNGIAFDAFAYGD